MYNFCLKINMAINLMIVKNVFEKDVSRRISKMSQMVESFSQSIFL